MDPLQAGNVGGEEESHCAEEEEEEEVDPRIQVRGLFLYVGQKGL